MSIRFTIVIAKSILKASRMLGRGGGSALPGLVAERLDPAIGAKLAARISGKIIIITGTNGKTTTSKMLSRALVDGGETLVHNRAGSNLSRGVVSALIEHVGLSGRFRQTTGLFEVDDAAMPEVAAMLKPDSIVVLNLFRDQLDRYGELDTTAEMIGRGIATTDATVYLNADDPLVASLRTYAVNSEKVVYFGVGDAPSSTLTNDVTADSTDCPVCGLPLQYQRVFFGHIGHYACSKGHYNRPKPELEADDVMLDEDGVRFSVVAHDKKIPLNVNLPGLYNIYNAMASTSVAWHHGLSMDSIAASLGMVKAAFGRVERVEVGGKTLYLLLVKNPTGFNQIIQTFLLKEKQQKILFIINDNYADGRDVSWLWDAAVEDMAELSPRVDVAGTRATDMAVRLKYADISAQAINSDIPKSLNKFIAQLEEGETGYVVPTYTAMLEARRYLADHADLEGVWE